MWWNLATFTKTIFIKVFLIPSYRRCAASHSDSMRKFSIEWISPRKPPLIKNFHSKKSPPRKIPSLKTPPIGKNLPPDNSARRDICRSFYERLVNTSMSGFHWLSITLMPAREPENSLRYIPQAARLRSPRFTGL